MTTPPTRTAPVAGVRRASMADRASDRSVALNQLLFGVVVLVVLAATQVVQPRATESAIFFAGFVIAFLGCALSVTIPWHRLPRPWVAALPVLDILATGFIRYGEPSIGAGLIWAFPVLWMSTAFGIVGAVASVASVCAVIAASIAIAPDPGDLASVSSIVFLPITLGVIAASSLFTARRNAAQRRLLDKQAGMLERALARARRHETLLAEVLDAVDFGVIRIAPSGGVTVLNDAQVRLQRVAGNAAFTARPAGGDDPAGELFAADGVTPLRSDQSPFVRAARGEQFEAVTVWAGRHGGRRSALSMASLRVSGDDGAAVLVSRDVTMELEALRAREDLVASVSHELRTPLTSIIGYLDLALDEDLPHTARQRVEVADRNASRLLEIVADILTASERGRADLLLSRREADLSEIVAASIEALSVRADAVGIRIDSAGLQPCRVNIDAFRLRQVVDNLLSNAVKYNREGGSIIVSTSLDDDAARLVVRDTGIGVSEAEQPRLFERFFRSEQVRGSSAHGSGLGLGISRDIVRQHGGELTFASVAGDGATVTVRIPLEAT